MWVNVTHGDKSEPQLTEARKRYGWAWARRRWLDLGTLLRMLLEVRRGPHVELWLGDSHALHLNGLAAGSTLRRAGSGRYVWHLGPRLMYSLSTGGFPPSVVRSAPVLRAASGGGTLTVVFVAGEIDVRCHLAGRGGDLSFVSGYVDQALALARQLGAADAVFVAPPPPSSTCPVVPEYPVVGTLEERLAVFHRLRAALAEGVARSSSATPAARFIDVTDVLLEAAGGLAARLTDDGIHTNALGVEAVQARLDEVLRATPGSASPGRR